MNNKRRERLRVAYDLLNRAHGIVSDAAEDEQDSLFSIPENLQASDKYDEMEAAADALESASESISDAMREVSEAIG